MRFLKRGQTATEYLIILAVVIVIALVVVVAMGKFPGIGRSTVGKSSQAYWAAQDIAISDYQIGVTSHSISLKNNMRNTIKVTSVKVGTTASAKDLTLGPGGAATIDDLTISPACAGGNAFTYPVEINYSIGSAEYTFNGDGNQLEGTCANN